MGMNQDYEPMIQHIFDNPFHIFLRSIEEIFMQLSRGEVVWHILDSGYFATLLRENQWIQVFGNIYNDRKICMKVSEVQIREMYDVKRVCFIVPGVRLVP